MVPQVGISNLRNAALFQDFPDEVLVELARHCRYMELNAGETLFEQGDPGDALYILEDGQIHVVRRYENGEEVVLATEGPYYVIGELSMMVDQPRTGGVVTVSDSTLIALSRKAFMEVCEGTPGMAVKVLMHLGLRLYRMNLMVREHAIGNVAARIASTFLLLSGGEPGQIPSDVRVTRIARAAATDADVVDRILQEWIRLEYIDFNGRRLTVHNMHALRDIAG